MVDEKTLYCLGMHFKCLYEDAINERAADLAHPCLICRYFGGTACNHHLKVIDALYDLGITTSIVSRINTEDNHGL